ncbi:MULTISPECIES: FmdB family zinc ribbon protein [Chitinibacter]|uniref:FmdB family zinc ribbon protein n=1 Tax=Chitinibacter TaxID=230666 RepID=UPI000647CAD2|nr:MULTISPECIES: zinc ribbon domain-containing protein [Chitinibacter]
MPLYVYRCSACQHQGEHLQKLADAPLTTCPVCQAAQYQKQLSAAALKPSQKTSSTGPATPHQCGPGCQH